MMKNLYLNADLLGKEIDFESGNGIHLGFEMGCFLNIEVERGNNKGGNLGNGLDCLGQM